MLCDKLHEKITLGNKYGKDLLYTTVLVLIYEASLLMVVFLWYDQI